MQIKKIILSIASSMALVQAVAIPQTAPAPTPPTEEQLYDMCLREAVTFLKTPTSTIADLGPQIMGIIGNVDIAKLLTGTLNIAGLADKFTGNLRVEQLLINQAKLLKCGTCFVGGFFECAPKFGVDFKDQKIGEDCFNKHMKGCKLPTTLPAPGPAAAPAPRPATRDLTRRADPISDLLDGLLGGTGGPLGSVTGLLGGLLGGAGGGSPLDSVTGLLGGAGGSNPLGSVTGSLSGANGLAGGLTGGLTGGKNKA